VITLVEWEQRRRDYRNGLPAWHGQFGGDRHRPALVESVRAEYERGEYRYQGGEEDYQARKGRLSLPL
jgi:hypothetical protein